MMIITVLFLSKLFTNRSLEFTYFADADKKYLIQSIKDTLLNRTIKFDYDDNNNLIKFTDAKIKQQIITMVQHRLVCIEFNNLCRWHQNY